MSNYDEEAFVREMQHSEKMQEQRQKVVVRFGDITQQKASSLIGAIKSFYDIKDDNNEINNR